MKAKLNSLNLKKGNTIFLYGNWNGNEKLTVDFFIQEYTVHSIGKVRCYLLIDGDVNSKKSFNTDWQELNVALTYEQAINDCKSYIPEYIKRENLVYNNRIESNNKLEYNHRFVEQRKQYNDMIEGFIKNINSAKNNIVINPYSKIKGEIIAL